LDDIFRREAAGRYERGAGGYDQGAVRAGERFAERFDGLFVDCADRLESRPVMDEAAVNHPVGGGRSAPQAFQILEIAAMRLGAGGGKRPGGRVRAGKAQHLMTRAYEFVNDGGADKSCSACDEDSHRDFSLTWFHGRAGGRPVIEIGD